MRASPTPAILQLHVSRHCNLTCSHCYSGSGPSHKGGLGELTVAAAIEDAAAEGYEVLSISGGEPLMDPALFRHAERAHAVGLTANVVTNGTLVRPRMAQRLARAFDLVAVSLDGPPQVHDQLRGLDGAFEAATQGLAALRDAGAAFAIIHTVRSDTLKDLRWLVSFAREAGAAALQLHPLEAAGRAVQFHPPEDDEADLTTRLMLLAEGLKQVAQDLPLQFDAIPLRTLAESFEAPADGPLASSLDPLVVEPSGEVVPFTYGAPRALKIADLRRERLADAADRYRRSGGPARAALHRTRTRTRLLASHPWPFVNWHAHLATASEGLR